MSAAAVMSPQDFGFICDLLRRKSAIVLDPGKEYLAEFRLGALAKREGFESTAAMIARLRARPNDLLQTRVVEVMTTNETSFFRDLHPFEALRSHVLRALCARRTQERRLTIWCAASSSGQEPYSVAMILRELGIHAPLWNVKFVATDLSHEMVTRCREGRYSLFEVNRGLPALMLAKHFKNVDGGYQASAELRNMIEFSTANLLEHWPIATGIDLVMMRNVLIYFDTETKRQILKRVRRVLSPFGCLFLGAAETTLNLDNELHKHQHGKATWYQPSPTPL